MVIKTILPYFKTSGTNYEIGFNIGTQFKTRIHKAFEESVIFKELFERDKKEPSWVDKLLDHAKQNFPQYIEEMQGIANGANIDFRRVLVANFRHFFPPIPQYACSTVIFRDRNKIILAHNEDHEYIFQDTSYLLHVELENDVKFLAHAYPGCLPGTSFSFNIFGIAKSCNAINRWRVPMGIPRVLLDRAMLEAKTINKTLEIARTSGRSGSFSYNIISLQEKRAVNLETSSKKSYATEVDDVFFHSNHFVSKPMKKYSIAVDSTKRRYERGFELIQNTNIASLDALSVLSGKKILIPKKKARESELGELFTSTLCTAMFELEENGLSLKIYPPTTERKTYDYYDINIFKEG